jgi:hypothetical protein
MNSHQRRKVTRAISRDEAFPLYDSHGYRRLFVAWDRFPAQQSFGTHFNKYVSKAKVLRAKQ